MKKEKRILKGKNFSKVKKFRNSSRNSKKGERSIEYVKKYYDNPEIEGNYVIFYHGTNHLKIDYILSEGLKGGHNIYGGTHGKWETPKLFLSKDKEVAEKYGEVIRVEIPLKDFKEFSQKTITSIDGLGDRVYIVESNKDDVDEILIKSEYLSSQMEYELDNED